MVNVIHFRGGFDLVSNKVFQHQAAAEREFRKAVKKIDASMTNREIDEFVNHGRFESITDETVILSKPEVII